MPNAHLDADKDAPLRYDIRLLGRILGETIRAQEGERTFDTIERIRLTALRFHRDADPSAARELQNNIRTLSNGEAIQIIRAFGHFSHLANIAEDQHHIRRSRAYGLFVCVSPRILQCMSPLMACASRRLVVCSK